MAAGPMKMRATLGQGFTDVRLEEKSGGRSGVFRRAGR